MPHVAGQLRLGSALRDAWELWRRHLRLFVVMAFAVVLPVLVLAELIWHRFAHENRTNSAIAFLVAGVVLAAFGEALCAGLAEHGLRDELMGRPRRPIRVLLPLLPLATLSVIAFIVGVAVAVGLALFVLPGLAAFAWLAAAGPAASFERHGVRAALATSVSLVRGRFWRVAAITSVTFLPAAGGEAIAAALHAGHVPVWLMILVETIVEAAIISYTAAVVVVVYHTLRAEAAQQGVAVDRDSAPG